MDWKTKAGIAGALLLLLTILVFIIKKQQDTIDRLKYIETSVVATKNLGKDTVRAQGSYVTKKDIERLIKDNRIDLSAIEKDLQTLHAAVKGVSSVEVETPGLKEDNLPSSETTPNPNPSKEDKYGYLSSAQWLKLTEPFEGDKRVPLGKVGFSAWKEKPWTVELLPRKYSSVTVLGQDEEGRHYAYSVFEIQADGKTYRVPVKQAKIVEEVPSSSFHFSPRLYLGLDTGVIANPPVHFELTPNIGFSPFSYGRTKISPEWSFLTFGLGYATQERAMVLSLAPLNYNLGKDLPLMDNLHIGPAFSIDLDGNVGLYLGARVAF